MLFRACTLNRSNTVSINLVSEDLGMIDVFVLLLLQSKAYGLFPSLSVRPALID